MLNNNENFCMSVNVNEYVLTNCFALCPNVLDCNLGVVSHEVGLIPPTHVKLMGKKR